MGRATAATAAATTMAPADHHRAASTPAADATEPHTAAPSDAPSHTINMANELPRPRACVGSCMVNVENSTLSIAIDPTPATTNAIRATQRCDPIATADAPAAHNTAARNAMTSSDQRLRSAGKT